MKGLKINASHNRWLSHDYEQNQNESKKDKLDQFSMTSQTSSSGQRQIFSSGKSSPTFQDNLLRTGLSFKSAVNNEINVIDQERLMILRKTCAHSQSDAKKHSRDIFFPSFFTSTALTAPENGLPSAGYYAKNIVTNQLLFKRRHSRGAISFQQEASSQKQKPPINNLRQKDLKIFVKHLYDPNQKGLASPLGSPSLDQITPLSTNSSQQVNATRDTFITKISLPNEFNTSKHQTSAIRMKSQEVQQAISDSQPHVFNETIGLNSKNQSHSNILQEGENPRIKKNTFFNLDGLRLRLSPSNKTSHGSLVPSPCPSPTKPNSKWSIGMRSTETDFGIASFRSKLPSVSLMGSPLGNRFNDVTIQEKDYKHLPKQHIKHIQNVKGQQKDQICFSILLIFISNLSYVRRKSNLQYKIIQIPPIYNGIPKKKIADDFEIFKEQIRHDLGIKCRQMYFFKQDGAPIENHSSFTQIKYNQEAIFFGSQGQFSGVQGLLCPPEIKFNINNAINQLCKKVCVLNNVEWKQPTNNLEIPHAPAKIQTKEDFIEKRNLPAAKKIAKILSFNPDANIKQFDQECKVERKLAEIENELQAQLSRRHKTNVELADNFERQPDKHQADQNLRELAKYIDSFLEKNGTKGKITKAQKKEKRREKEESEHFQGIEQFWNQQPDLKKIDHIAQNIQRCHSKNSLMKSLQESNRELFVQNIPKLLNKYELSRHDLHSIYILYKALLSVSVQQVDFHQVQENGIDFKTLESGIDQLSSQGEEIIKRMCNYNLYINWESFLDILSGIQGKSLESKINIFIKVSDRDKSGSLERDEIEELCEICLSKFIPQGGDTLIEDLTEYFTKLLFQSLDVDIDDAIPLEKLKVAIIDCLKSHFKQGHPESDLLCFFCGIN